MTIKISELPTTDTISSNTFIPVVTLVNEELVTLKTTASAFKNYIEIGTTEAIAVADLALRGYVDMQVSTLIGGAPGALNTLGELSAALGNNANLATTLTGLITDTRASVITANTAIKGYVDAKIAITNDKIATANVLVTDYVDAQILIVDTAIDTANTAMKQYVDALSTTTNIAFTVADTVLKSYVDDQILGAVVGSSSTLTDYVDTQIANTNTAIDTANVNMKGYVDSQTASTVSRISETAAMTEDYIDQEIAILASNQVNSDWNAITGIAEIKNKPILFSGSYIDLTNKPTIPTKVSALTNDSNYQTAANVAASIQAVVGAAPAALDTLAELAAQLISDESAATALTNLVATKATISYVDSRLEFKANVGSLSTVATTGSYTDLIDQPVFPTTISTFTNDSGYQTAAQVAAALSDAANLSSLANVATTGSYTDLINTPTIPVVPTTISSFTNNSGYQTAANVAASIQAVVGAAPAALDTLVEIAAQLATDSSAAAALTTVVSTKASTTYVDTQLALKANISSLANVATTGSYTSLINKPTTLSGYGITNAQPLDADLTAISALTGTAGKLTTNGAGGWTIDSTVYSTTDSKVNLTTALGSAYYIPLSSTATGAQELYSSPALTFDSTQGLLSVTQLSSTGVSITTGGISKTGGTAPAYYLSQDGTGRQHWYWNTSGGIAPVFSVSGEDANDVMHHAQNTDAGGFFAHRTASGLGKVAGDPITWITTIYADLNTFSYKGNNVYHAGNPQTVVATANALTTTNSYTVAGLTATNGIIGTTVDASGYGVRIRASTGDVQGILQWVNNAQTTQWTSLVGTNGTLNCTTGFQSTALGVGTAPSATIGEIRATNNITAYYSDSRLKSVTGNITNALDKVCALNGVVYTNNQLAGTFGYTTQEEQVGVLAQEVKAVMPQVVTPAPFDIGQNDDGTEFSKSGEDYMTVRYERLVPLLIEAIKELNQEVISLRQIISGTPE